MGSAGAAIEYDAHKKTLRKLERALDLLEGAIGAELITFSWEDDAKALLESAGRVVEWTDDNKKPPSDEPHEETGFGD
jgi:hypothetical protein